MGGFLDLSLMNCGPHSRGQGEDRQAGEREEEQ